MKKVSQLKEYDMFGREPCLYIGGKDFYGTGFGLLISIIAMIAMCVCSLYFIIEMFDTQNVSSFTSVQNPSKPLAINFTSDKFYFGLAIQDPITYDFVLDETIYRIEASYKVATRKEDGLLAWEETPVEIEPCVLDKFNSKYREIFEKRNVQKMYCVKNFNHTIEGTFLHDKYSFIMFDFFKCENTTENGNKCKPKEKIDYYLNGTFASVEFTDISLDPSNYSYPDSPILGEVYSTVSNSFFREMHLFLKAVQFKSDRGLVFSSIKSQDYIQLDYLNDMFTLKTQANFCSFTLKISNRIDVYERTYTKFQTTLANMGGIVKAITVVGQILTFFYSKTKYELDMTNKIFFINEAIIKKKKRLSSQNVTKVIPDTSSNMNIVNHQNTRYSNNYPYNNNPNNVYLTNNFVQQNKAAENYQRQPSVKSLSNTKLQYLSSFRSDQKSLNINTTVIEKKSIKKMIQSATLSLSTNELLFSKICHCYFKSRKNIKLLMKGGSIIREKLDIVSIVRELLSNSRIRQLLFSQDQAILFDLVYRPPLSLEIEKRRSTKSIVDLSDLKNEYSISCTPEIKRAFDNIVHSNTKGLINNNEFLKCLDPNLKLILSE